MEKLKLISWNVNGIRAAERKGFLDWMEKDQPDIIGIQETKASPEQLAKKLKEVPGYHSYFNSAEKKGYSGVAIYCKKEPLDIKTSFGYPEFDTEGRTLIADYGDYVFYTLYFPNGQASKERLDYKMAFYQAFLEHCQGELAKGKKLIICGDVNTAHQPIDLARPKENEKVSGFLPCEREWIDQLLDAGFIDSFRHFYPDKNDAYSWWSYRTRARERNVGWRLDYFYVSENLLPNLTSASIRTEVMGSDHCPVELIVEV